MPSAKPLRSGTCAITLLAMITSARLALGHEALGQVRAEELPQRRDAGRVRRGRLVGRRVDARAPGRPRSTKFFSR